MGQEGGFSFKQSVRASTRGGGGINSASTLEFSKILGQVSKIRGVFGDKSSRFGEFSGASSKWNFITKFGSQNWLQLLFQAQVGLGSAY